MIKKQVSAKKYNIFPGKICFLCCALALLMFCAPAPASELDTIVDRIQNTFSDITDMKGSFSQTSYIKDIEETQMYSGTFFIKKPALMMWEYAKPRDEQVTIKDIDTWIYKKSENQVIRTKLRKETYSQVPIVLLSSFENIRKDFHISLTEKNALQLVPKKRIGFLKTLVMETVPEGFPIKMFTLIDTYGNIIMIDLNRVEINPGLDDALFEFKVPEGAEIFDLDQ